MMDSGYKQVDKNKNVIDTTSKNAEIFKPKIDTGMKEDNEYKHVIDQKSVQELNEEKSNDNIIQNIDDDQSISMVLDENQPLFVKRPVPALSRELSLAINKVYKWGDLKRDTSQPVHDAISALKQANSESEFVASFTELLEKCINYMTINAGTRKNIFGSGEQRKEDIRGLLDALAKYAANSGSNLLYVLDSSLAEQDQNFKYTKSFKKSLNDALTNKYGNKLTGRQGWQVAEEGEQKMLSDLEDWGGSCEARAKALLAARKERPKPEFIEFDLRPDVLERTIKELTIPDTKSMDDYALLANPQMEIFREKMYNPLMQNLNKLIFTGQLTDMDEILKLRTKMEVLRQQLNLYDARLSIMAGEQADLERNELLVNNALYLQDMEEATRTRTLESMKGDDLIASFKGYEKVLEPNKKLTPQDLRNRLYIIEQNRAKQDYVTMATSLARDTKLQRFDDEDRVERYKKQRGVIDRVLSTDFSELLNTNVSETGLISNLTKRQELLTMLTDLEQFLDGVYENEGALKAEEKEGLNNEDILLMDSEKQELSALVELGRLFNPYLPKLRAFMDNEDGYSVLKSSDYHSLPDGEHKQHLLTKPEQFGKGLVNEFKAYKSCVAFKELKEIEDVIGAELADKAKLLKTLRTQNAAVAEFVRQKREQERLEREQKEEQERLEREQKEAQERKKKEAHNKFKETFSDFNPVDFIRGELSKGDSLDKMTRKKSGRKVDAEDLESTYERLLKKDVTIAMKEYDKLVLSNLLKEGVKKAVGAYNALSDKNAKPGDELKARELCVNTMSELSGVDKEKFDLIPTDVIANRLSRIETEKYFDSKAFNEDVKAILEDAGQYTDEISGILVPLSKKKDLDMAESLKLREYSMCAMEVCLDKCAKGRKTFDKFDTHFLTELALGLLAIDDIDLKDKEKVPTENELKKVKTVSVTLLSLLTGKDKAEYEFIPVIELSEIMYEATSRLGSELEIVPYIEEQVTLEKRKKIVRDGSAAYEKLDKKTAKKPEIDKVRNTVTEALVSLSGSEKSVFDQIPIDKLYEILKDLQDSVQDPKAMEQIVLGNLETLDMILDYEGLFKVIGDLEGDKDMSQDMKDYLVAEYGLIAYGKMLDKLGFTDQQKDVTREGFDPENLKHLPEAVLMGTHFIKNNPDSIYKEDTKAFKEGACYFLSQVTGKEPGTFADLPVYDLKKICRDLIKVAGNKEIFEKTVENLNDTYLESYRGQAFVDELTLLMGKASEIKKNQPKDKGNSDNYALRDLREVAIHFIIDIAKVEDISREELEKLPGMTLYTMALEQATREKEIVPEYDPKTDWSYRSRRASVENKWMQVKSFAEAIRVHKNRLKNETKAYDKQLTELKKTNKKGKNDKKIQEIILAKNALDAKLLPEISVLEQRTLVIQDQAREEEKKLNEYLEVKKAEHKNLDKSVAKQYLERDEVQRDEYDRAVAMTSTAQLKKEIDTSEKHWSKEAEDVFSLLSDLISMEKLFDKKGNEVPAADRMRTILSGKVSLLTMLLNQRANRNPSKGVMNEISRELSGPEAILMSTISGQFLDSIFGAFEHLGKKDEGWTEKEVADILNSKEMAQHLQNSDKILEKAIGEGDVHITDMVSEAADDLFGSRTGGLVPEDDVLMYIINNMMTEEEREKIIPKEQELTDKEKLQNIRDSVFDMNNGQGKFLYKVIKDYYKEAPLSQRRFMMSYLIKDLKPTQKGVRGREKGAIFFASMLKGAGPIMQKLFQGIPEHMLMKQFMPALSVVKSGLRPIPTEYVDRQLAELKRNANDNLLNKKKKEKVTSIEKVRSLGAASIAETFLCNVTYEGQKGRRKEQVVVKIMRPDVNLERLTQEKRFIEKCAAQTDKTGVMLSSFNAHYNKIVEELDFGNEIKNANMGEKAYTKDPKVHSVKISTTIPSGKNYLVMDKAEGVTADRYIEELKELSLSSIKEFDSLVGPADKRYTMSIKDLPRHTEIRKKIADKLIEAQKCQKNMEKLVETWIQDALFTSVSKHMYFHHGDLHAGNIMINKDFATVLDYGNCTTLDNSATGWFSSGKVDNIVKMMAAAFKGFSGDFVKFLEAFIALDGDKNDYNSLPDMKKKEMKDKLTKELEVVLKLGGEENTGERIFVALLKAQEAGFKLPQELINFSQCQQRLENSLNEFNGAIESLKDALEIIDRVRVTDLELHGKEVTFDPVNKMLLNIPTGFSDETPKTVIEQTYMTYRSVDKEEIRKTIRDPQKLDAFREGQMRVYMDVKEHLEGEETKAFFADAHKKMIKWNKEYSEYKTYKDLKKEDILDKKKLKKFDYYKTMKEEMGSFLLDFSDDVGFFDCIGKFSTLSDLAATASMSYAEESWERLYELFEVKLQKMYSIGVKFDNYQKAVKEKVSEEKRLKLEEEFLDAFCDMYEEDTLERNEIVQMSKLISPDLDLANYHNNRGEIPVFDSLSDSEKYHTWDYFDQIDVTEKDGTVHKEYLHGKKTEKVVAIWPRMKELHAIKKRSPQENAEWEQLIKEAGQQITFMYIESKMSKNCKKMEEELADYFKDESAEGKEFKLSYQELRKVQEEYVNAKYEENLSDKEMVLLKQRRIDVNKRFLFAFRNMVEKRLRPVYDSVKDYRPTELNDFVSLMEDRILNNKKKVLAILKTDSVKYVL